jgi:hypothetical protein
MNEHAIYEIVGAKKQRCVNGCVSRDTRLMFVKALTIRLAKTVGRRDHRHHRPHVGAGTSRPTNNVRSRGRTGKIGSLMEKEPLIIYSIISSVNSHITREDKRFAPDTCFSSLLYILFLLACQHCIIVQIIFSTKIRTSNQVATTVPMKGSTVGKLAHSGVPSETVRSYI